MNDELVPRRYLIGDIAYHETIEFDGHTIYIEFPSQNQKELLTMVVEVSDKSNDLARGIQQELRVCPDDVADLMRIRRGVEVFYDALLHHLVVAWDLTDEDGRVIPCTAETKANLPFEVKAEISKRLVQVGRLWLLID